MSDAAFRVYKKFAAVLCVCAVVLGGFLGWRSRGTVQQNTEHFVELPTETTGVETTQVPEMTVEQLTVTEQIYRDYFESSAFRGGTYTLQDLDANGVPEMLIWPDEEVHEIVTIVDGEPVVIVSDYGLFLCEGNIIGQYGEGSGGCTVWYYAVEGAVTQPLVCIVWLFHEDAWYTSTDYTGDWDTMIPITKDQKNEIVSQYLPLEKDIPDSGYLHFLYQDVIHAD